MRVEDLRGEWRDGGHVLVIDCPCIGDVPREGVKRCGGRIRIPACAWSATGALPNVTLRPSVHVPGHVHFTITDGALTYSAP